MILGNNYFVLWILLTYIIIRLAVIFEKNFLDFRYWPSDINFFACIIYIYITFKVYLLLIRL